MVNYENISVVFKEKTKNNEGSIKRPQKNNEQELFIKMSNIVKCN